MDRERIKQYEELDPKKLGVTPSEAWALHASMFFLFNSPYLHSPDLPPDCWTPVPDAVVLVKKFAWWKFHKLIPATTCIAALKMHGHTLKKFTIKGRTCLYMRAYIREHINYPWFKADEVVVGDKATWRKRYRTWKPERDEK